MRKLGLELEDDCMECTDVTQSYDLDTSGITFIKEGIVIHKLGIIDNKKGHKIDIDPHDFVVLVLGRACGTVQRAMHKPTGLYFAIKCFNIFDKDKRHQLVKDISVHFSHLCKNLVRSYGAYYTEGYVSLVLEYMDLGSLVSLTQVTNKRKIKIPEPILATIVAQILRGLYYLHKKLHQIHRDLKPDNILLNKLGEIKLTDFGISKAMESTFGLCGSFVGTPSYMSPERIQGTKYSFPSDVWSIGIILYEMATGSYPYPLKTSLVELYEHIVNNAEPALDPKGDYSEGLRSFISSCLKKNTNERLGVASLMEHTWIKTNECTREEFQSWLSKNIVEPSSTETLPMTDIP